MRILMAVDWRDTACEAMSAREWACVEAALGACVRGDAVLPGDDGSLLPWESHSKASEADSNTRVTWKLTVAYLGHAFSGFAWQKYAVKPTVQGCLQDAILPLLDGRSELRLSCAGRTDAGVSALGQLVSFHSPPGLTARVLSEAIAKASPEAGALRLVRARRMDRSYHATFSTSWRRYAYLLPPSSNQSHEDITDEATRINAMLRPLEGETRDYAALGRSVPEGKETAALLRHASARVVSIPGGGVATRVDLVGDRFLRRQV